MRLSLRFVGTALLAAWLAGCAGGPQVYELNAAPEGASFARRATVRVRTPKAPTILDGDRILERQGGSDPALLPGVAWSDRLPEVVATRVIETLRNAQIRASGERGSANVDYDLRLDIRDFAFDAADSAVKVTIAATIVALASGKTVASKALSVRRAVDGSDPTAIAAALDRAFGEALIALPRFVAAAIP